MTTRGDNRGLLKLGLDLAFNIGLPALILIQLSGEEALGPIVALVLALSFPLGVGLHDLLWRGERNFFSLIGFVGVLLTGGIGLLQLDSGWLAVKEASVPAVIGLAILGSRFTAYPLVPTLLGAVIDFDRVRAVLRERGNELAFERRLKLTSWWVAGSFFVSAVLNYLLARWLVTSDPGTVAFNEELGRLTLVSYPVIAVPSMLILWLAIGWLVVGIHRWSGLATGDIFRVH